MTLEQNIVALTAEVTKMLGKVDESRTEALREVYRLSNSLPYKYIVSTKITPSTPEQEQLGGVRTAHAWSEIQTKIEADRAASGENPNPNGLDRLTTPYPVSVFIESFNDTLPMNINTPNVELVIGKSGVFKIPPLGTAIEVDARDVTINGGTFAYVLSDDANKSIKSTAGTRTEVRGARLVNCTDASLDGVDGKSLDNVTLNL